jgi:hypothetical protein
VSLLRFDFDAPFVASDGLIYAGKRYRGGEPFLWRALGIDEAEVWDLWVLGLIGSGPATVAAKPEDLSEAELERLTAPRPAAAKPAPRTQPRR